jgi:serine/threonine protein kinase
MLMERQPYIQNAPGRQKSEIVFKEENWCRFSPECRDFIGQLLCMDNQQRITAEEALEHPWIRLASTEG